MTSTSQESSSEIGNNRNVQLPGASTTNAKFYDQKSNEYYVILHGEQYATTPLCAYSRHLYALLEISVYMSSSVSASLLLSGHTARNTSLVSRQIPPVIHCPSITLLRLYFLFPNLLSWYHQYILQTIHRQINHTELAHFHQMLKMRICTRGRI